MIKKLSHPFIAELKRYVANQNTTLGPIVTYISEIIPIRTAYSKLDDVRDKQQKLSEVTDMIHAAHVFHRCVRDSDPNEASPKAKRLHQDNIMSLLVGDYLLAQSSVDMAELRFPKTVGLIARGLEDYTLGEFLKLQLVGKCKQSTLELIELKKGVERHAELTCGSLLANACLSSAILSGHPGRSNQVIDEHFDLGGSYSDLVYAFGFHTGSAQRLMEIFHCQDENNEADKVLSEILDVRIFNKLIHEHLDKSTQYLLRLPNSFARENLLASLTEIRKRLNQVK